MKYIVFTQKIKSVSDGDIHKPGAYQLISLYRVDSRECVIMESHSSHIPPYEEALMRYPNLIPLTVRINREDYDILPTMNIAELMQGCQQSNHPVT
jgi:hypothetical protein